MYQLPVTSWVQEGYSFGADSLAVNTNTWEAYMFLWSTVISPLSFHSIALA